MHYLSIGTNVLLKELFLDIKNSNPKPIGGIWMTYQDERFLSYNPWVDYICEHPYLLFYKNNHYPNIPAVYITLKKDAKIFNVTTYDDIKYLKENFPYNGWIDFQKLSTSYDGIYFDYNKLYNEKNLESYSVNTTILFNLDCIEYYQEAEVNILYLDPDDSSSLYEYDIQINEEKKYIKEPNKDLETLIMNLRQYIIDKNIPYTKEGEELIKSYLNKKELINESLLVRKIFHSI